MQSSTHLVHGNLALAPSVDADRPCFYVIDGGRRSADSQSSHNLPSRSASSSLLMFATITLLVALASSVLCFSAYRVLSFKDSVSSIEYSDITVAAGDTLWSIASEHAVSGISTNDLVQLIMEQNDLSSGALQPGQIISVPRS